MMLKKEGIEFYWDNKPIGLYWVNTLHYLVVLLIDGAILAVWV